MAFEFITILDPLDGTVTGEALSLEINPSPLQRVVGTIA